MLDIDFKEIDPSKILIEMTDSACKQLELMMSHDFTLEDKSLRVQIGGKGCDGFTYQVGFDQIRPNDYEFEQKQIKILMQPFTAYFCKNIKIDYIFDSNSGEDGFTITNNDQELYQGKFFKT